MGRIKVQKLTGWDKDSLVGKAKATHTSEAKEGINSLLPFSKKVFSHFQESKVPSHVTVTREDKRHHSKCPSLPSSSPSLHCWPWCHTLWDIPLVSCCQLSQLCPLPTSYAPPAYLLAGQCEKQRKLWGCASTAQK